MPVESIFSISLFYAREFLIYQYYFSMLEKTDNRVRQFYQNSYTAFASLDGRLA